MAEKKSDYTTVTTVSDSRYFNVFGQNTDEKISKPDLFNQVRDEIYSPFIYPTVELLQAADLEADEDFPVYVRVEENQYKLYKITSLAAGVDDITLNNGATATFQVEYRDIGFVIGPESSVAGALAIFSDTSGAILDDTVVPTATGRALITASETATKGYFSKDTDNTVDVLQAGAFFDEIKQASASGYAGVIKKSTAVTVITGNADDEAVTPLTLQALTATETRDGLIEIATRTEAIDGDDQTRAMTPYTTSEVLAARATTVVETFADLATTPVTAGSVYYLREYYSGTGKGGRFLVGKAGFATYDNFKKFSGSGGYFEAIEPLDYLEHAGSQAAPTDSRSAIDKVIADGTNNVRIQQATTSTGTIRDVHDLEVIGDDTFDGIYRKWNFPETLGSDDLTLCDVSPAKHLRHACSVAKPVVVLIGDSISTYSANTNSRGDMLVETLREKLNHDFPNGVTFYNRAIGGQRYGTLFTDQHSAGIPWYTTNTVNWITDVVTALAPDLVIFSFGMNDSSIADITAMKAAIDYLQGLSKPPSIIHCTNFVPRTDSVNVTTGDEKSTMDGRDYAAGLYRTYAKFRGIGLIDIHRKYCKTLDGFDPASTALKQGGALTLDIFGAPNNRRYTSTSTANERQWAFYFDDSAGAAWMNSGVGIVVDFTGGTLQLTRSGGNLGISYAAGGVTLISTFVACTFTNTLQWNLTVEMKNGWLNIYSAWDPATGYGGYVEPIYSGRIAYPGGESINRAYSPGLMNANFREGIYIKNRPSIKNSDFWGVEGASAGYEGSGFNHPSHWAAAAVYRDMIQSINFYSYVPRHGQVAIASGIGSIQVALTPNELNANYRVFVEFSDIGGATLPVVTGRVEFRATNKFDYFFTANTNYEMTMHWTLIRF